MWRIWHAKYFRNYYHQKWLRKMAELITMHSKSFMFPFDPINCENNPRKEFQFYLIYSSVSVYGGGTHWKIEPRIYIHIYIFQRQHFKMVAVNRNFDNCSMFAFISMMFWCATFTETHRSNANFDFEISSLFFFFLSF